MAIFIPYTFRVAAKYCTLDNELKKVILNLEHAGNLVLAVGYMRTQPVKTVQPNGALLAIVCLDFDDGGFLSPKSTYT